MNLIQGWKPFERTNKLAILIQHWKLILISIILAGSNYLTYQYIDNQWNYKWQEANVEALKSTLESQKSELDKQKQIVDTLTEVNQNAQERNIQINSELVDANESVSLLKQKLNSMSSGGKSGDSASAIRSAANAATDRLVLSQLLTNCAERYKRMAETADRSRAAGLSCQEQYNKIKGIING